MSLFNCLTWASFRGKISKGNNLYHKEKFDKALKEYQDAQINNPESIELHFNLGNALYKKGEFEQAYKEYEMATYSKNALLQAKAYYNMGNSLYRQGKLAESIQVYKKSLEINPDDEDAKYNIELVQKKIKEQLNKKQDPKDDQKKSKSDKEKEESKKKEKGKEKEEKQKKDTQKEEKKDKDKEKGKEEKQKEEDEKDKKPQPEKPKEGEMSKEDALRILNALDNEEKAQEKKKKSLKMKIPFGVEEDW